MTGISEGPDGLVLTLLVPCPECEEAVELTAAADTNQEYPLEETRDVYD